MTWPLALDLTGSLPHGSGDLWQNLWNFWWWKKALTDLVVSPYATDYLFFPHGVSLALHTHSPFNQIAALPINLIFGPIAAYNFATLASLALSGLGAYLLARELVGSGRAAFVAGLVFAFFPHHLEQTLEHLNLASTQFLPFVCLFAIRMARTGRLRDGVVLGVFFALNALSCLHYAVFVVLALPVIWVVERAKRRSAHPGVRQISLGLLAASITAAALLGPFVWPIFREVFSEAQYVKDPVQKGIDLAFLWLPSAHHPVLGSLTRGAYEAHRGYPSVGFLSYLGMTVVALSLVSLGWMRRERQLLSFWILAFAFLVLALGSEARFLGREIPLSLPHSLFESIPLLNTLRVANRFVVMAMLALGVLAAAGLARLDGKHPWIAPAAYLLVLFEYLWIPFPVQEVAFSPGLEALARGPEGGAVLDIPFCDGADCPMNMGYQTIHGRPIAGGYVSVLQRRGRDPMLDEIGGLRPPVPDTIDVEHLRRLGFGAIVFHKDRVRAALRSRREALPPDASHYARNELLSRKGMPGAIFEGLSQRFEAKLGPPDFEDESVKIYRIR